MTDLLLLPGDGIGPEVTAQVRRVAGKIAPDLTLDERPFGGSSFDQHGSPLTDETLAAAKGAKAVLMGAVGGPKWKDAPRDKRPEAGLLGLRAGMGVFANLRPAICFQPLANASSLKRELVEGLDFMIVRELTGGVYFGEPRFIEDLPNAAGGAVSTPRSTPPPRSSAAARVAFELARLNKVSSAEKSNVMETGLLWREVVTDLHAPRVRRRRAGAYPGRQCGDADRQKPQAVRWSWSPTTCLATSCPTPRPSSPARLACCPRPPWARPGRPASTSRSTARRRISRAKDHESTGRDPVVRDGAALGGRTRSSVDLVACGPAGRWLVERHRRARVSFGVANESKARS